MSDRDRRCIINLAIKERLYARDIRDTMKFTFTVRKVQQVLRETPHVEYKNPKNAIEFTRKHKQTRVQFARQHLGWARIYCTNVILSDKKTFNLDGPDGFHESWKDIRIEPEILSRCQQGGRSVMVWGASSNKGTIDFVQADGNINSEYNCTIISQELLPETNRFYPDGWVCMQNHKHYHEYNYKKTVVRSQRR